LVINLPDIGKTPRGLASGNSAAMTGLTIAFNQALAENLQPFNVIQADMPWRPTSVSRHRSALFRGEKKLVAQEGVLIPEQDVPVLAAERGNAVGYFNPHSCIGQAVALPAGL
jgi:hypothetical protein